MDAIKTLEGGSMSKNKKLSMVDSAFLMAESSRTPQHVSGLSLYTLPEGVSDAEFLHDLADSLKYDGQLAFPFGHKLRTSPLGVYGPMSWQPDDGIDFDYHIRHSALPSPGRYRELFALTSRWHGTLLDRSRPLWELHLIEGLPERQFAVFFKVHHAAIDGVGGTHVMQTIMSNDPNYRPTVSPFSQAAADAYKATLDKGNPETSSSDLNAVSDFISDQFKHVVNLSKAFTEFTGAWLGRETSLAVPMRQVPRTPLNDKVDGSRRFVAQSWSLARIKAVGKAIDGTLNDAVLGMVSGALRRYLENFHTLPKQSLKTLTPVSLRDPNDVNSSNAVASICADLATNIADPEKRLVAIRDSMRAGKQHLQTMSPSEVNLYLSITSAPVVLLNLMGLSGKVPAYSVIVSNIPGPQEQLYWNGAPLNGSYPVSIVVDGVAVNFTVQSYRGNLDFGIVACRRTVPHIQRLIDYLEDALAELEQAVGLAPAADNEAPPKKTASKRKAAKKSKD